MSEVIVPNNNTQTSIDYRKVFMLTSELTLLQIRTPDDPLLSTITKHNPPYRMETTS